MAAIAVSGHRYRQTALVCNIAHERPHGAIAHERFLPGGPFAILPMTDDPKAARPHRSSVVWSEAADVAERIAALASLCGARTVVVSPALQIVRAAEEVR